MADAVIVAAARSPIGRAFKGSLKDLRPDNLTATIVRAALDKVPQLDPSDVDDLMLGCGLPGGEAGFNMARVTAVLLGYDHLPGTTLTRYCASSLQTTRMAMHAIKVGEGEVFISAGVETVSRHVKGSSDSLPDTMNPLFGDACARTATPVKGWHDPREDGMLPDAYIAMGQTAENVASMCGISRAEQDEFAVRSQNLAEQAIKNGFYSREISDIDLVEINEAFAAQVIPAYRELGIDIDRLNVHGGAIALGHPFGMTGARITATLLNGLVTRDETVGLETMCIGGGQGMAMIIERLN